MHTYSGSLPVAATVIAALIGLAQQAEATSSGIAGVTNKTSGAGCGACHGASNSTTSVAISGPSALGASQSGTYTVTATKSGIANGTKMGIDVAASDSPTPLSTIVGQSTAMSGDELVHNSATGPLMTTVAGSASYQFTYAMPAGAAPGSTHVIYAVANLGAPVSGNWNHASSLTVTTRPVAPNSATASGPTLGSINLAWSGGGPEYRVVYRSGATAPANENDGTAIDMATATSTTVTGLAPSTPYSFAVFSKLSGVSVFSFLGANATATTASLPLATRYVDVNTGTNNGNICSSLMTPCKTITHAMSQATPGNPGDTINVAAGTYSIASGEVFPITMKSGTQLASTGTPETTIIDAAGDTVARGIINSNFGSSSMRIEGFTFRNGLYSGGQGSSNTCGGAIAVTNFNGLFKIYRNIFAGNEARGFDSDGTVGQLGGYGLGGALCLQSSTNAVVLSNVFVGNIARGGHGFDHPATPFTGNETGGGAFGGAMSVTGILGAITENTFYGNQAIGARGGTTSNGLTVGGEASGGAWQGGGANAPTIANNIFANNSAASGNGSQPGVGRAGAIYSAASLPGSIHDNLFFANTVNGAATTGDTLGTSTVTGDPLFIAAPANLRIKPNSPAAGAGYVSGTPFDLTGAMRPVTPSIGAFEPSVFSANPVTLDFGGQSMQTTAPAQSVTIANNGVSSATVQSITAPTHFAVSHNCGALAAGAACTANVTFTPTALGALVGTLTITSTLGPLTVPLAGVGELSLVTHYYRAILNRAPDSAGKSYWESEAARLQGLQVDINEAWYVMAGYFFNSAEYLSYNKTNTQFVTDLYNTFFNRAPDSGGLNYWVSQIVGGLPREVVLFSFMFSPEFRTFTQGIFGNTASRAEVNVVIDFFRGILNRLPDTSSFQYWLARMKAAQCAGAGPVYTEVDNSSYNFIFSAEYAARNRNSTQLVTDLYYSFLRRGGDTAGVQYWVNQLNTGAMNVNTVRSNFLNSPEFGTRVAAVIAQGCSP